LEETIRNKKYLYENNRGRPTLQKALDDKNKGKMEQRKKGFKQPSYRNNSQAYQQGQPKQNESNMIDLFGKRPR
jgi:hypothetical protein